MLFLAHFRIELHFKIILDIKHVYGKKKKKTPPKKHKQYRSVKNIYLLYFFKQQQRILLSEYSIIYLILNCWASTLFPFFVSFYLCYH